MFGVMHRRFVIVEDRIMRVPMRHLRFMSSTGIVFFTAKPGGLLMMVCRLLMVGRGFSVVSSAADSALRRPDNFQRSDGDARTGIRWFWQIAQVMPGIMRARLVSIFQPEQRMPMGDQSLMRSMGIIFSNLVVP